MKRFLLSGASVACLAALVSSTPMSVLAQGQVLVIQGGTLIDGNGGAPVPNSVIVIQGNRIAAIGRVGAVPVPAGAQVINANGKFVLPGLIDAKSGYFGYYGEAYLHWGVTSVVSSGGRGDVGEAERDAIAHGLLTGPRLFQAYATIDGPGPDLKKQVRGGPGNGTMIPHSVDESHQMATLILDVAGADFIGTGDGDGPPEIFAAAAEEAHKRGKPVVMRPVGPQTRAHEAAAAGANIMIHTGEVAVQISKDPDKWKNYIGLPPDPYCDIDMTKEPDMIKYLVGYHVALEPDAIAADRGFSKNWKRIQDEDAHFFDDPELRAYFPAVRMHDIWENVKSPETYLTPDQVALRTCGFKNHMDFLHKYVAAGGHIVAASDIPQSPPGLGVLQELTVFVDDAGLTPMQGIQSATKWVAEAMMMKDLGTVETGKLADIVIVNDDPLKDILNLRKIDTVVKDGKVVDRAYHSWFRDPFLTGSLAGGNPVVEGVAWTGQLKQATGGRGGGAGGANAGPQPAPDPESAPTPGIESIMPYIVNRGSPTTTVTLTGFNFVQRSQVFVDNIPVPVKVVSRTQLQATVDQNILARAGSFAVVVKNPEPIATADWGDTSNTARLIVPYEFTTLHSHNKF